MSDRNEFSSLSQERYTAGEVICPSLRHLCAKLIMSSCHLPDLDLCAGDRRVLLIRHLLRSTPLEWMLSHD